MNKIVTILLFTFVITAHAQLAIGPGGVRAKPINIVSAYRIIKRIWTALYLTVTDYLGSGHIELPRAAVNSEVIEGPQQVSSPEQQKKTQENYTTKHQQSKKRKRKNKQKKKEQKTTPQRTIVEIAQSTAVNPDLEALKDKIKLINYEEDRTDTTLDAPESNLLEDSSLSTLSPDALIKEEEPVVEPSLAEHATAMLIIGKWPLVYTTLIALLATAYGVLAVPYWFTGVPLNLGRSLSSTLDKEGVFEEENALFTLTWLLYEVERNPSCLQKIACQFPSKASKFVTYFSMAANGLNLFNKWIPLPVERYEELILKLQEASTKENQLQDCRMYTCDELS